MARRDGGQRGSQLFISYARTDAAIVDALVGELRELGYQPFFDSDLTGGQAWWDTLLDRIEASDVFLPVLSQHYLDSEACYQEADWAASVGVAFLPVDVARVDPRLCPRAIANANWVRYELEGRSSLARLSHALRTIEPGSRPPVNPPRPEIPMTYFGELEREISGPLDWERQLVVIATLKGRLGSREDALARRLLRQLQGNQRISYTGWREIEAALKQVPPADDQALPPAPRPVAADRPASPTEPATTQTSSKPGSDETAVGQKGSSSPDDPQVAGPPEGEPALLDPAPRKQSFKQPESADTSVPDRGARTGPGSGPVHPGVGSGRGKLLGVAAVLALVIASGVAFVLTRSTSPDSSDPSTGGMVHDVPIATVVEEDTFGHFGDPAVMTKVLQSPCTNIAPPEVQYAEYRCTFKEQPSFYIDFNNGDPLTTDAHGLPESIQKPGIDTIVAVQAATPSLHAYVMTYKGPGDDDVRDTGDDVVTLALYDVDTHHPGSAEFKSENQTSDPLTREVANQLLESIGADETKFRVPQAFELSINQSSGNSPLRLFAAHFLTPAQLSGCVEGFLVVPGESEHVTCCETQPCSTSAVTTSFGLQRNDLAAARYRYRSTDGSTPRLSYSDETGLRGEVIPSRTRSVYARLFWGLLVARVKDTSISDLRGMFEAFANHPAITGGP
jgi:TIR domain